MGDGRGHTKSCIWLGEGSNPVCLARYGFACLVQPGLCAVICALTNLADAKNRVPICVQLNPQPVRSDIPNAPWEEAT